MSRLSEFLLDMATWIAPQHRRQWIAGLRAEAAVADRPTAWAWGALTTALGQRLIDTVASGLAVRFVLGGFVMSVAIAFAVFVTLRIPGIETTSIHAHRPPLPLILILAACNLLLLSGGLAILLSRGTSWLNHYGRALFALGGLYTGCCLGGAAFAGHSHAVSAFQNQMALLSTLAGPLFIAAAVALLCRRLRLFLVLAGGALAMQITQYGLEWPRMQTSILFIAFFNACGPGLLMLSGSGLLIGRRTTTAA